MDESADFYGLLWGGHGLEPWFGAYFNNSSFINSLLLIEVES